MKVRIKNMKKDIGGKLKNQVCNVMVTEGINLREDIKINEEIKLTSECI